MPTGYTDILDETGDEFDWLKRVLVRNFGITFMVRDSSFEMSFEDLDKNIREYGEDNYHRNKLKELHERETTLSDEKVAREIYKKEKAEKEKYEKESIERAAAIKEKHDRAEIFLNMILKESVSGFTKDVAKFGLKQLKLVEHETEPYIREPMLSFEYWLTYAKAECKHDIEYHEKELREDEERDKERAEFWNVFTKDMAYIERKYGKRVS